MSVDPQDFFDISGVSDCCQAAALGEIDDDNIGICSKCGEHAEFTPEEEDEA